MVVCRILLAFGPVSYNPSSSPIQYVTGKINHLKHRNKTEVVLVISTGLEGSRFPKLRLAVWLVNEQDPLDTTVAVTDTELELPA
jgi:hypothetical protein